MAKGQSSVSTGRQQPVLDGDLMERSQSRDVLKSKKSCEADKHQQPLKHADEAKERGALKGDPVS